MSPFGLILAGVWLCVRGLPGAGHADHGSHAGHHDMH